MRILLFYLWTHAAMRASIFSNNWFILSSVMHVELNCLDNWHPLQPTHKAIPQYEITMSQRWFPQANPFQSGLWIQLHTLRWGILRRRSICLSRAKRQEILSSLFLWFPFTVLDSADTGSNSADWIIYQADTGNCFIQNRPLWMPILDVFITYFGYTALSWAPTLLTQSKVKTMV